MMTGQSAMELAMFTFALGAAFAWWRGMVFARKLRHFGIDLDAWAHYDERERQRSEPTR